MKLELTRRDLLFMIETLMPEREDKEDTADRLRSDEVLIEAMLNDDRLFERLMSEKDVLLVVSPRLFFAVLLRQAQRDLQQEAFTVERRARQKVVMFDADRVIELLEQEPVRDYLADMLASFTRVHSVTIPIRVRRGIWHRIRTSDLDVESLMRYVQNVDEALRFEPYKRIGDVCLFMAGLFPEYIDAQYRYPLSRQVRPGARGRLLTRLEDYEEHGRAFYRLAAEHEVAHMEGIDDVLNTLSESFVLAEKPLAFLSSHYLGFTRQTLFGME
jgi:hypothetical protein